MGISITMQYNPAKIDENRWPEAFQEAMKIGRAGKLAEVCVGEYEGNTYYPLRLSEPISRAWFRNDTVRWHATGDLVTGSNMEDFSLPAVWKRNQERPPGDILLASCQVSNSDLLQPKFPYLWDSKTQGERGHIWLLAMACVLCDHFPEGFFVYGDITAGQCIRACKIAAEVLDREVRIPIQFDAERLLPRVQAITDGEQETLDSFFTLYKGLDGPSGPMMCRTTSECCSPERLPVWPECGIRASTSICL